MRIFIHITHNTKNPRCLKRYSLFHVQSIFIYPDYLDLFCRPSNTFVNYSNMPLLCQTIIIIICIGRYPLQNSGIYPFPQHMQRTKSLLKSWIHRIPSKFCTNFHLCTAPVMYSTIDRRWTTQIKCWIKLSVSTHSSSGDASMPNENNCIFPKALIFTCSSYNFSNNRRNKKCYRQLYVKLTCC